MLYIGGADNLLSLDYRTIIHIPRMRVKTFLQKISKIFFRKSSRKTSEILPKNHPQKIPLKSSS